VTFARGLRVAKRPFEVSDDVLEVAPAVSCRS
jgi:hypothetical protein